MIASGAQLLMVDLAFSVSDVHREYHLYNFHQYA